MLEKVLMICRLKKIHQRKIEWHLGTTKMIIKKGGRLTQIQQSPTLHKIQYFNSNNTEIKEDGSIVLITKSTQLPNQPWSNKDKVREMQDVVGAMKVMFSQEWSRHYSGHLRGWVSGSALIGGANMIADLKTGVAVQANAYGQRHKNTY